MTPDARLQAAIELTAQIASNGRPADGQVSGYMRSRRYIGSKDRRVIVEKVYGVLRRRARLDWHIARSGIEGDAARLRIIADLCLEDRLKPAEIEQLFVPGPHCPDPLKSEERRLIAILSGRKLFHPDMPDWVRGEYPEWIEPSLRSLFGDNLVPEMGAMRDEAPLDLRVNLLKATREQAIEVLAQDGLKAVPTEISPVGLRLQGRFALMSVQAFRNGLVEVQDEGSQLVAFLTAPQPGESVVDFCAGAGGKTLALAAMMQNKGRLIACDVGEGRIARAQERLRRAGVHNVTRRVLSSESDKWVKRSAGSFDRVLVDAPCTGTGTWRRNPDAKWHMEPKDVTELSALQVKILASAQRLVKPGGRLVYATCSLLPEENEAQVEAFLAAHLDFELLPLAEIWAEAVPGATPPVSGDLLRLTPLDNGTDGFFGAAFRRKA